MVRLKTILKIIFSIGLLGYLIYLAKPEEIITILSRIWLSDRILNVMIAILIFLLSMVVYAFRWKVLLDGYGIKISLASLFNYYLVGLFFNNFLPTGIGGDVIRIYKIIKHSGDRTIGFASVMTERILAIASTLILTLVSLFWLLDMFKTNRILYINLLLLLSIIFFFTVIFSKKFSQPLNRFFNRIKLFRLGERINKLFEAIRFYHDKKIVFLKVIFLSLIAQIMIVLMTYFLNLALSLNVSLLYLFLVVPITFIITMLPSINGLGVREYGFVFLLAREGISKAGAISLSFLVILVPIIISLIGGILFIIQRDSTKMEELKVVEKSL